MSDSENEEFASADEDFDDDDGEVKDVKTAPPKVSTAVPREEPAPQPTVRSDVVENVEESVRNDTPSELPVESMRLEPTAAVAAEPVVEVAKKDESNVVKVPPVVEKQAILPEPSVNVSQEIPSIRSEIPQTVTEELPNKGSSKTGKEAVEDTEIGSKVASKGFTGGIRRIAKPTTDSHPKPSKLVLKKELKQADEVKEQVAEAPSPVESKPSSGKAIVTEDAHKRPQPEEPIEEKGWDDFEDDWGDFTMVEKAEVAKKQPPAVVLPKQKQPPMKTSFKDIDIDDVEDKLNDFMKHQNDPPLSSVFDRISSADESKSSGGAQSWGAWTPSWGGAAVSFLSSASKSVASITTNITQVIESGIGVPNPEDFARRQAEAEAKLKADGYVREEEDDTDRRPSSEDRFGFDQIVSGVTNISSKVISGGLDTLEGIGKKTMTILQENDPGLLNKRKLLGLHNDGVVLSQVLREAKEKTEDRERNLKQIQKHQYKRKIHFELLFDDYHGLVHLEALEMLSKQAEYRLESLMTPLTGKALEELQETMEEVKELCELPVVEHDDADGTHLPLELEVKLNETVTDLDEIKVDFSEIVSCWGEYLLWLQSLDGMTTQDIFEKAMNALAQTTALCVLRMHKLAEALLIRENHSTASEADALIQLTIVFCWHVSALATRFSSELSKRQRSSTGASDEDGVSALITNIFLESSNSISYIQNAFQLFIPILQIGAA